MPVPGFDRSIGTYAIPIAFFAYGVCTAGDDANRLAAADHRVAMARDATVDHLEPDEAPGKPALFDAGVPHAQ